MHLLVKVNDPVNIARTSSDVGLAETIKAKYKLEKGKRGYVISSINDCGVQVATQLLANVMRKCRIDEVPTPVIARME